MKTKILTVIMLFSLTITACARTKKVKKHHAASTTKSALTMLSMFRTSCFGRCPTYEVVIYSNGLVEYRGKRFTEYTGVYRKNLGQPATDLLAKFASMRIDTCKPQYEKVISDVPGIIYKYTMNGRNGQILNADFGPHWLKTMSTEVDFIVKIDPSWKKISSEVKD